MPVRVAHSLPVLHSFSVLDVVVIAAGLTLFLDLAFRPLEIGPPQLFGLLCIPLVVSAASTVWSDARSATLRATLIYAEGLIAYLFVVRELEDVGPDRVVTYMRRYAYFLIVPAVFLVLHVPGFAPEVSASLKRSSGGYLTYYTRLSHPVLGGSNNLATVLAFFAPILVYWGHVRRDRRTTLAGAVTLLAIFLTLSRGVLLSFVIAGLLYGALASRRRTALRPGLGRKITAAAATGLAAIAVFYALNPTTRENFATRFSPANVKSRVSLLDYGGSKIASRPLLGYGDRGNPPLPAINSPPQPVGSGSSCLGCLAGQTTPVLSVDRVDTHNTYVQQALYYGLPLGLVVSLALWGVAGVFLAHTRSIAIAGVIAFTLLTQLVSFLFESSFVRGKSVK
jgi:hypothetical protein